MAAFIFFCITLLCTSISCNTLVNENSTVSNADNEIIGTAGEVLDLTDFGNGTVQQEIRSFLPYQEYRSSTEPPGIKIRYLKPNGVNRYKDELISRIRKKGKGRRKMASGRRRHHSRKYYYSDEMSPESYESTYYYDDTEGDYSNNQIKKDISEKTESSDPITYTVYPTKSMGDAVLLPKDGIVVGSTQWKKGQPVKVLIHGFFPYSWKTTHKVLEGPLKIISGYSESNSKLNLILCNWTIAATRQPLDFNNVPVFTKQVGEDLAMLLMNLKGAGNIKSWSDVHIIGFSIGAHIAGATGWHIQKYNGGLKPGRITGLDPANSGFETYDGNLPQDSSGILDRTDADFVDIIHCNQGALSNNMFGSTVIAGHADFYPNGGERQPSCTDVPNRLCSHEHCLTLFAISMNNPAFKACQCPSWMSFTKWRCNCIDQPVVLMGDGCPNTARGLYFLRI